MNHSPWYVDHAADYERQRIREDMKQIRLEQRAMKAEARTAESSQPKPSAWRAFKHATLVVAQAILAMFA